MQRLRGTCIALEGHGVLLRGDSEAGKSDLALRLIDAGGELVSDDYTDVSAEDGRLVASAPPPLHGLLEIRGVGIVCLPAMPASAIVAAIDLVTGGELERMPTPRAEPILGVSVPVFQLVAREASAVARVRLMIHVAVGRIMLMQ
jgi:Serine kinase of the HPr protein, regulates carbohydrate metabolism